MNCQRPQGASGRCAVGPWYAVRIMQPLSFDRFSQPKLPQYILSSEKKTLWPAVLCMLVRDS